MSSLRQERLALLREKYAEIRRLRGDAGPAQPRPAMVRLASRFPGALRELDALPLQEVDARLEAIGRAEADTAADLEPWMHAQLDFHALARGALAAKRWLGGAREVDADTERRFRADLEVTASKSGAAHDELFAWTSHLALLARPPSGRLTGVILDKVAERLGVSREVARALVVPTKPAACPSTN